MSRISEQRVTGMVKEAHELARSLDDGSLASNALRQKAATLARANISEVERVSKIKSTPDGYSSPRARLVASSSNTANPTLSTVILRARHQQADVRQLAAESLENEVIAGYEALRAADVAGANIHLGYAVDALQIFQSCGGALRVEMPRTGCDCCGEDFDEKNRSHGRYCGNCAKSWSDFKAKRRAIGDTEDRLVFETDRRRRLDKKQPKTSPANRNQTPTTGTNTAKIVLDQECVQILHT